MNVAYKVIICFFIVTLGFISRKIGLLGERDGKTLSSIVIDITIPFLIMDTFTSVALEIKFFFLVLFGMFAAFTMLSIGWLAFRRLNINNSTKGSLVLTFMGFNLTIFAYPFAKALWGQVGLAYMAMFDLGNVLIIYIVGYSIAVGYSSEKFSSKLVAKKLLTFPPLMAFCIALIINFMDLRIPEIIRQLFKMIGNANAFLSLMIIGIYLNFGRVLREIRYILEDVMLRYLVGFCIGIFLYIICRRIFPSNAILSRVVLLSTLMPTPILSIVYSSERELDPEIAGGTVTITVIVSSVILFLIGIL